MGHISLYRKYRSQTFDEIIGQDAIVTTLKNSIINNRLAHAYLFTGPRGTGKTSTARIYAKALNCSGSASPNPCKECSQCAKITSGHALNVMEIDAASNRGIDEIRDLREKIRYKPVEGKYKIYIIDEVHMLTNEAFNALLKTLEEPPHDTIFILATTEPQRVPLTISSRCQRFDFGRISFEKIASHLRKIAESEKFKIENDAVNLIARASEGSLRDAISLMDQLVSFCEETIKAENVIEVLGTAEPEFLFDIGCAVSKNSDKEVLSLVEKAVCSGVSIPQVTKDLIYHFRNLMLAKIGSEELLELSKEQISRLKLDAALFSLLQLKNILKILSAAETDMKWHQNARLVLEVALLEICEDENKKSVPSDILKETVAAKTTPASESDTLTLIKNRWADVLEKVKAKSLFGYVSLNEAALKQIDSKGRLVLEFKKGFSFHKTRVEEAQNMEALKESIDDLTGKKISVICVLSNDASKSGKTSQNEPTAVSVDDVVELFDGKLISKGEKTW